MRFPDSRHRPPSPIIRGALCAARVLTLMRLLLSPSWALRLFLPAFAACAAVSGTAAAADHDGQTWLTAESAFDLGDQWSLDLEAQARFRDFADRLGQTQYKATLSRSVTDTVSVGAGYGRMIAHNPNAPDAHENRLWQQAVWKPGEIAGASLAVRARLEQRFIAGDTGWRARSRISAKRTLGGDLYAYGSGEVYFFLNDTRWGARSGFDQLRLGAGLGFPLSDSVGIEAGYLNRLKRINRAEDQMSHIISVTLKLSM